MNGKIKAVFNWSGGKDSSLALYKVLQGNEYDVIALLTTVSSESMESSMHKIPVEVLQAQADSIGIPLHIVRLPANDLTGYDREMENAVNYFKEKGVRHFIFGDIYLHDVKSYRESKLLPLGIEIVEPLWDKTTSEVMDEYLNSGFRAKIVVTQADKLDKSFVGMELDRSFIDALPENVDLCGEEGEYHSFAYGGPIFNKNIKFKLSEPQGFSYDINLDDGTAKTFHYWQSVVILDDL